MRTPVDVDSAVPAAPAASPTPIVRNPSLFEQAGFSYVRPKGKKHCVMRIVIR